jgi:hypothetical protein
MIERRDRSSLLKESIADPIRTICSVQEFDRDVAPEDDVMGEVTAPMPPDPMSRLTR